MDIQPLRLLLVEDDLVDAKWIGRILSRHDWQYKVKHVKKFYKALESLERDDFDAVLLDLSLPDNQGIEGVGMVHHKAPHLPIVILTGNDDLRVAVQSLQYGAQDYLIKGEFEDKTLAHAIRHAIERQRIDFKIRQQALMKKMLDKIRNSIELETVLKTTGGQIQKFLHTDWVSIYRCDSEFSKNNAVISSGNDRPNQIAVEKFISAINAFSPDSLASAIAVEDNQLECSPWEFEVKSYLVLPIWLGESAAAYTWDNLSCPLISQTSAYKSQAGLWGILVAYNTHQTRKWHDWETKFLQRLTAQVTVSIRQSQLCCQLQTTNQELQQLAIFDGLTRIANRRYFDLVLDKEWHRLTREQKPLSLILCDVDHFKAYNDTYGHQQGDRCLQQIAEILKQSSRRPADLVARYGGEEFAVILPNTDAKGALFIAQTIARKLAQKQLPHQKSPVSKYVTCSMGIATTVPNSDRTSASIIETADRLLYRAKKAGRDRIATDYRDNHFAC